MTSNTLSNIQASLMRFCNDFVDAQALLSVTLEFVNFDAHADEATIPNGDLIGIAGLGLVFDDSLIDIQAMVGLSTEGDTNLFRLSNLMGQLLELLRPECLIRVYDSESGDDIGWMVIKNGTRLMPVGGATAKPLQYVIIELATSVSFQGP